MAAELESSAIIMSTVPSDPSEGPNPLPEERPANLPEERPTHLPEERPTHLPEERPTHLPKATVPVQLPPEPASPSSAGGSEEVEVAQEVEEIEEPMEPGEVADLPTEEEIAAAEAAESVAPKPVEPKRGLVNWLCSLNIMEKFCLGLIVLGVVVFAAFVFVPALFGLPKEPVLMEAGDFPISGDQIKVSSGETYWRSPVTDGPDADPVQAGIALVPVLEMKLSGKGKVRILFRDGLGQVAGDLVTLELSGDRDFAAACTTGLKERGEFTAYQVGEIEPWLVEFHEVDADAENIGDDTMLFKMRVAPILK